MLNLVNLRKGIPETKTIVLGPWAHGVVTSTSRSTILNTELSDCVNWYLTSSKTLSPVPAVVRAFENQFQGSVRGMYFDSDGTLWVAAGDKVYKLQNNSFTENGTLDTTSGSVHFYRFSDKLFILDGSYVKFIYGSTVRIAYDGGTGERGYIYNKKDVGVSSYYALYSSYTEIYARFVAPTWGSSLGSIPILRASFYLSKDNSSATGGIWFYVYRSPYQLIHSFIFADASKLPLNYPAEFIVNVPLDMNNGFTPGDTFYVGIWYSSLNYSVRVHGSNTGTSYRRVSGAWQAVNNFTINCAVSPSLPPKAGCATTWLGRSWLAGDPDNPGRIWFGNLGMLDFSTPLAGGWVGIGDDGSQKWRVGALTSWLGDLYVVGAPEFPYLVRIRGSQIDQIQQQIVLRNVAAKSQDHVIFSYNDLCLSDSRRVWSLSFVRDYGDLRSSNVAEPVRNFTAENPIRSSLYASKLGANLYSLENSSRILVQSLQATTYPPGKDYGPLRTPWSFWQIYREDLLDSSKYDWETYGQDVYYLKVKGGVAPIERPDFLVVDWADIKPVESLNDLDYNTFWFGQAEGANLQYETVFVKLSRPIMSHYMVRTCVSPVLMYEHNDDIYFCCSDGRIYKTDYSVTKDMGIVTKLPMIHTGNDIQASSAIILRWIKPILGLADGDGTVRMVVYRGNALASPNYSQGMDGLVKVQDLIVPVAGTDFSVSEGARDPMFRRVAIHAESYSVRLFVETEAKDMSLRALLLGAQPLRY